MLKNVNLRDTKVIFTLKKEIDLGFELARLRYEIIVIRYKLQNLCEKKTYSERITREGRVV